MANWDAIKQAVEGNGNVKTFTMGQLRDAYGAGKLGINVRAEISSALAGIGLGTVPPELPAYQESPVRVYKYGTPVGDLISTVLSPGEANDEKLTSQFPAKGKGVDYAAIVQKIKELVE